MFSNIKKSAGRAEWLAYYIVEYYSGDSVKFITKTSELGALFDIGHASGQCVVTDDGGILCLCRREAIYMSI